MASITRCSGVQRPSCVAASSSSTRAVAISSSRSISSSASLCTTRRQQQHCQAHEHLSHRRRASVQAQSAAGEAPADLDDDEPSTAQEAITAGLRLTGAQRWSEALNLFERALNLPGTGIKRFRDKPRAASDRERMTALYNIACCHSALGDARSGLVALASCLELGYADWRQIQADPDLAALRADSRFEGLVKRFQRQEASSFLSFDLGSLFGGGKK